MNLMSCIPVQWTTNGQGQIQSIGLPGVPLWQSQTLAQQNTLAREGSLAAIPGTILDSEAQRITAYPSDADWLREINRWRTATGGTRIGANPDLNTGSAKHAEYLVRNGPSDPYQSSQYGAVMAFSQYAAALGGAAHTEEPSNPYFTQAGYDAAHGGAADVNWSQCNGIESIDGWLQVPFHRLSILAPWMRVAGYGEYGDCPISAANLTIRGSTPVGLKQPVMFPPNGGTVNGTMNTGEWPNPLDACPGYSYPIGTPITLQLGADVKVQLLSYDIQDETTGRSVQACGFDAMTYPGEHGRGVLTNFGAVVVVPRHPLKPGNAYHVTISTNRHDESWDFRVGGGTHLHVHQTRTVQRAQGSSFN
jgi:hypothetical protein